MKENRFSVFSLVLVVLAFVLILIALEAYKVNTGTSGMIFPYLVEFFALFNDSKGVGVSAAPSFPLTESNIIKLTLIASIAFSIFSIVFAGIGRRKNEKSIVYAGPLVISVFLIFYSGRFLIYL